MGTREVLGSGSLPLRGEDGTGGGNRQSANRIHFGEREGVQGGATQRPPAQ